MPGQINLNNTNPPPPTGKSNVNWQAVAAPVTLNVTGVSNSGGACELALSGAHNLVTGDSVFVDSASFPAIAGGWNVTVVDSTHVVLIGSVYGPGYPGGGYLIAARDVSAWVALPGGVNSQTGNYTAVAGDSGKLISFNSATAVTLLLPAAAPSGTWWIAIENVGAGALTVSPNGLNLDGVSSSLVLAQNEGLLIFCDGSNYKTMRGMGGTGGGSGSAGGVNAQTTSYTAVSGDDGKLISFSSATAVTLTLPAAPPSATWWIAVQDVGAGVLTVNRNSLTIDGAAANLTLSQNSGVLIYTDGTDYFTERGTGGGGSVYTTSWTSQTSVTVTHGLGTLTVAVQVFDTSGNLVEPQNIAITSSNVVTLTFGAAFSGLVNIFANAGTLVVGSGSVTSVALTVPAWLTATGSPIVGAGTIAISGTSESANQVLASPNGSAGAMAPRALVAADIPNIAESQVTNLVADLAALSSGGVPATRNINTTAPLTGGGALSSDLTLVISPATTSALGVVKPDGTTITIAAGVISAAGGSGTVTSVSLTLPSWLTVTGSPVTASGTLAITGTSESANLFLASPNGSSGAMTPRAIVPADLPVATTGALGVVQPDGTTITIAAGVLSAVSGGPSGAMVLLEEHTASGSATLDFTSAISGSYDDYVIRCVDLVAATNAVSLLMEVGTGGGPTYDTASHYMWSRNYVETGVAGTGQAQSSSDTSITMAVLVSSSDSLEFHMNMSGPAAAFKKKFIFDMVQGGSDGNNYQNNGSGVYTQTTALTALRFKLSSGNITSGTIRIYGISH